MRLLISGLLIFLPLAGVHAQDLKGKNAIGAALGASFTSDEGGDENFTLAINPAWVHFYSDRSAVGIGLWYNYFQTTYIINDESSKLGNHRFMLYPYWRHHYPFNEQTGLFLRAEAGVGYTRRHEYVADLEKYREWRLFAGGRAGFYHFLTDRLSLELNWGFLQYSHTIAKHSYGTGHSDAINLDLSMSLGECGIAVVFEIKLKMYLKLST